MTDYQYLDKEIMDAVWSSIQVELVAGSRLHPTFPADPLRRTALMCEEAGEALKAALDLTRPTNNQIDNRRKVALFSEVLQTAAVAVLILHSMYKEAE